MNKASNQQYMNNRQDNLSFFLLHESIKNDIIIPSFEVVL